MFSNIIKKNKIKGSIKLFLWCNFFNIKMKKFQNFLLENPDFWPLPTLLVSVFEVSGGYYIWQPLIAESLNSSKSNPALENSQDLNKDKMSLEP